MSLTILSDFIRAHDALTQTQREIDYANRLLQLAAQQDQDERHEDAALSAQEARYEAWLSLEGPNP